ncbi:hypothetical protein DICPUDRAFT_54947 [Dictyostelium purpureum]|uniref:C2 domain-containing protein n=1 Tax=Dictyostelium purpureum TaxID=5786 RepID=F0ZJS3_DICPU|nr:uncharacterized protein DICPUDRAFT_54947 [Dictyostelium purpureum]EGC35818.1 hypothetical protein DICPUDRAFT_54947 [Dictyostelium purpureum]|eukprot:XP_003287655.1 hypothetical protein DICPUDRAFT_54947 [Dictyostelium purpureum]
MNILQVNVIEGRDLVACDSNGFSDSYCTLSIGQQKKKTKIIKKSLNPKWGETFLMRLSPLDEKLHVLLQDWDQFSSDDFMGECFIDINSLDDTATWYPLQARQNKDDFVKGEICIKARVVKSSNIVKDKIPTHMLTEVNNRVTKYENENDIFDLSAIGLEQFPDFLFEHVAHCDNLDLGFNQFKMFPSLSSFKKLTQLTLNGNFILTVPGEALDLPTLKVLSINGNHLISLPAEVCKLVSLEKLEIANNRISELCPEIANLPKLEELIISGNPLTKLPPNFSSLTQLEILDAGGCQLVKLPEDFSTMTKLLEVNFGNNKLVELPNQIGRLTRLTILNLMDNKLTDLPLSIGNIPGLGKLGAGINIEGNPIQSEEIIKKYKVGNDQLMEYLEKRMALSGYSLPEISKIPKHTPSTNTSATPLNSTAPKQPPQYSVVDSSKIPNGANPIDSPQQQKQQLDQDVITKTIALKNWVISTIRGEIRPKIGKIKNQVLRCVSIQEGVGIANIFKQLKPEIEKLRALIPPTYPIPPLPQNTTSGKTFSGNEKLEQLKDLVALSIDDYDILFGVLYQLIPNHSEPQLIVSVTQSLKKIKEMIP